MLDRIIGEAFGFNKLKMGITKAPVDVPAAIVKNLQDPEQFKRVLTGLSTTGTLFDKTSMRNVIANALATGYYRRTFYRETESAIEHPYVLGAILLYIDSVTAMSSLTNRSVWVTSEDEKLQNVLNQFYQEIGTDERIRDWTGQLAEYGDFFMEAIGRDGLGVSFVDDNIHPADMERIDINGRLEGFVRTGMFKNQSEYEAMLEAPWKYVHFRTFGLQRRYMHTTFGIFGQPDQGVQYQLTQTPQTYRVTTRYGTSLLTPAVPVYKRLKLAEDSILMSRYTRGVLWYLYHIKIKGGNFDSASALTKAYARILKRRTSLDVTGGAEQWKTKYSPVYGQVEDVFVPESDDMEVSHEPMGGDPDIRAIVDIDLLTNQLLGALRVSKAQLGLCLRGDTKIRLLDGRNVTVKEIADHRDQYIGKGIYACDTKGNIVPRRIADAGMTRPLTEFVRVTLDNGEHFDITPDHPCMMRDGTFRKAELLEAGDSLMPLYTKVPEDYPYELYYNPADNKWHFTHQTVAKTKYRVDKIPKGKVVHHGYFNREYNNFDKLNNDFDHIHVVGKFEHMKYHGELTRKRNLENNPAWRPEVRAKISKSKTGMPRAPHQEGCHCALCKVSRGEGGYLRRGKPSWNKDLTKETDIRVAAQAEATSKGRIGKGYINSGTFTSERLVQAERDEKGRFVKVPVLNHKVVSVERLDITKDAYDLQIEGGYNGSGGREHCFALSAGVFVHNTEDLPGAFGQSAAMRISINFAKTAHRLQDAMKTGLKRLGQIHLAYLNMDPDPSRFEVNFTDISSAEEEEIKDALDKGVDVSQKITDMIVSVAGEDNVKKLDLLDYLNRKILKLNDLELAEIIKDTGALKDAMKTIQARYNKNRKSKKDRSSPTTLNADLYTYLPRTNLNKNKKIQETINQNGKDIITKDNAQLCHLNSTTNKIKLEPKIWSSNKVKFTVKEVEKKTE